MFESAQEELVNVCSLNSESREDEVEIKIPKDKSQGVIQKWVDKEMKLLKSLYDRMVMNYYQMTIENHGYVEQLERSKAESVRFKKVAYRVTKMVKELGCNDSEKCATYSDGNDETLAAIASLEVCCKALVKEVPEFKRQAADARREREALDKQLAVVNEQLAAVNGQLAKVAGQLVAVTGELAASAVSEAKLRKHADDMAERYEQRLAERSELCEKRLAERSEQHASRMAELSEEHADAIRRLTAESDERHADEIRELTEQLDAAKSWGAREAEELRVTLHEQSARAQADRSAAAECAADQRASIARLSSLLENRRGLERAVCDSVTDADESPAAGRLVDGCSTGDDGRDAPPSPRAQQVVAAAPAPWSPISTDSSSVVTFDMVRYAAADDAPPTTVQCGYCVADGTSDSTDCAANGGHPVAVAACPPEYGLAELDRGGSSSAEHLRLSPDESDNVSCEEEFVMKLIDKYKVLNTVE